MPLFDLEEVVGLSVLQGSENFRVKIDSSFSSLRAESWEAYALQRCLR